MRRTGGKGPTDIMTGTRGLFVSRHILSHISEVSALPCLSDLIAASLFPPSAPPRVVQTTLVSSPLALHPSLLQRDVAQKSCLAVQSSRLLGINTEAQRFPQRTSKSISCNISSCLSTDPPSPFYLFSFLSVLLWVPRATYPVSLNNCSVVSRHQGDAGEQKTKVRVSPPPQLSPNSAKGSRSI